MAEARNTRLVELWQLRKQRSQQLRQHWETVWLEGWRWYRNQKQTRALKGQNWMSNRQLPDGFRIIETLVANMVGGMLRNPRWFSVEAPTVAGDTYQRVVHQLVSTGWRQAEGTKYAVEAGRYGHATGTVTTKVTYEKRFANQILPGVTLGVDNDGNTIEPKFTEEVRPKIVHNGVRFQRPDNMHVWLDPTRGGRYVIERMPASLSALKELNKQANGTLYFDLDKIQSSSSIGRNQPNRASDGFSLPSDFGVADLQDLQSQIDSVPEDWRRDPDSVTLWQCWGYVDPQVRDYSQQQPPNNTQWRLQVIANEGTLIRDEPAPSPFRKPPYVTTQAIGVPGHIYGDTILSYIGPLIDLRSEIENMRRDEVLINIFGTYAIDGRVQLSGQKMLKTPGGAIKITPDGMFDRSVRDFIHPIPRQPILPEAYIESQQKERQILDAAAVSDPMLGRNFSGRPTAFEVSQVTQLSGSRHDLTRMWWNETFLRPLLELMFHYYQMKLTTPQIIELTGAEGLRDAVDFSTLQYDVDIHVDTGTLGSMDANQLNGMSSLIQMFQGIPEAAVGIKWKELAADAIYRLGLERDYERSDQEVQAIQQQQFQQQLALLQAEQSASAGASTN